MQSTFEKELEEYGILVYKVQGISMMPLLRQNRDLIVLKKKEMMERCKKYDTVMFKRDNGQYVLHRILKVRERDYIIVGDNCRQEEVVRENQILAIMTSFVRDEKTIEVTDRGYQCYVHLWCDFFGIRCLVFRVREILYRIYHAIKKFIK